MKAELRARIVPQAVRLILRAILDGYDYNPGSSDLDDEQPINVRMTLGEYRRAREWYYANDGT